MTDNFLSNRQNSLNGGQFVSMQNKNAVATGDPQLNGYQWQFAQYPSLAQPMGLRYPSYIPSGPNGSPAGKLPYFQGKTMFDYQRTSDMFLYEQTSRANQVSTDFETLWVGQKTL